MDIQLKELIEKIKDDGVRSAEDDVAHILAEAQKKAASIVKTAEEEARRIRDVARIDIEKTQRSGIEALRQAGRDILLSLRVSIESLFDKVIQSEVSQALDQKLMAEAIIVAVHALVAEGSKGMEVQISDVEFASIEPGLRNALASELAQGMEIHPFKGLSAGFRISMKDGSAFYDFSDQEIMDMLSRFLNPRLKSILSE